MGTLPFMFLTGRRLILALSIILAALGLLLWVMRVAAPQVSVILLLAGFVGMIAAGLLRAPKPTMQVESADIREVSSERRRELMRGTSLSLREMEYRYSVRLDTTDSRERRAFSAEVNTIRLGFVPAIITDNTNDRQGFGYVAFVHDGARWRGPGLPCPADQTEAMRHAARCVSPLSTEEETSFEA
ncbi:MAG: hypothetical protein SYC29_06005 [Planctomycetota bacterium]|nr:hypothetical protein [Planctomycetota bacterium]